MIDLDLAFVSSVLHDGKTASHRAIERGVQLDFLHGDGRTAYEFVCEYAKIHGTVPDPSIVLGKTGVDVGVATGPAEFFIAEILNRQVHFRLQSGVEETIDILKSRDPQKALDRLEQLTKAIRREVTTGSKTEGIAPLAGQVKDLYDKVKAGARGILTPWPSVNEETYGFWPQDLVIFVGRLGKGKTWIAVALVDFAWASGHKVLFATTEMSKVKIVQRLCAYRMKLPYDDLRKGRLGVFAEKKFYGGVQELMKADGIEFVGGDFDFRIESFRAAVDEAAPEAVFLDGAYLVKVDGGSRTERAANVFDELKRQAHGTKIPHIVTTQFNREAKANMTSKVSADQIALTDVAGWNGDVIYGVVQSEDMKKDQKMGLQPIKMREGPGIEPVKINWNFDVMDFSEIPQDSSDASDDYDTGMDDLDAPDPAAPF